MGARLANVALKDAVDEFEVAYDRPTFYQVIPPLPTRSGT